MANHWRAVIKSLCGTGGAHPPAAKGAGSPNSDDSRKSLALCLLCGSPSRQTCCTDCGGLSPHHAPAHPPSETQPRLRVALPHLLTKRCRLSWLTNSALIYEPKCGGCAGSRLMSTAVQCTWSPNKFWKNNSIFNLWLGSIAYWHGNCLKIVCTWRKRKYVEEKTWQN